MRSVDLTLSLFLRLTVERAVAQALPQFHEIMHQPESERASCAVADLFARSTWTVLGRSIGAFCDAYATSSSGKVRGKMQSARSTWNELNGRKSPWESRGKAARFYNATIPNALRGNVHNKMNCSYDMTEAISQRRERLIPVEKCNGTGHKCFISTTIFYSLFLTSNF